MKLFYFIEKSTVQNIQENNTQSEKNTVILRIKIYTTIIRFIDSQTLKILIALTANE